MTAEASAPGEARGLGRPNTADTHTTGLGTPSREHTPKKIKRNGKNITGFYYHASEYQRKKQLERGKVGRILSGILEPFSIHVRAARLWYAARRSGGGNFAVLNTEFVEKALDGLRGNLGAMDSDVRKHFRAKSQAHGFGETLLDLAPEEERHVQEALDTIIEKKGKISNWPEFLKLVGGENKRALERIAATIRYMPDAFQTADNSKISLKDEILYGSLTPEQKDQAIKLARAARRNTILTAANYAKIGVLASFYASNPAGWAIGAATGVSIGLSAATRWTRLSREGYTHGISKSRGVIVPEHRYKNLGLARIFGVDWDEDPANKKAQMLRAVLAGAAVGVVLKIAPDVLHDVGHDIGGIFDHMHGSGDPSHHIGANVRLGSGAKGVHGTIGSPSSEQAANIAQSATETHQVALSQIGQHNYHAEAWGGAQHGATWAYDVHNTWTDHSMTFNIYDHADKINYFALHMPNHQVAIVDLAHSSIHHHGGEYSFIFDKNNTHDTFTLMDTNGHPIGTITSQEAYKLFNSSGHLAPSTGASSDFAIATQNNIRSLIDFGNYHAGAHGGLDFTRYGEVQGHGGFGDLHALTLTQHANDPDVPFHSDIAPQLQQADNFTDNLHIGNWPIGEQIDPLTDFALHNTDEWKYLWQTSPGLAAASAALLGVPGYALGRYRRQHGPSANDKVGAGGIVATSLLVPGAGIPMAAGYLVGRIGRKGNKGNKNESSSAQTATNSPTGNNPAAPSGAATSTTPASPSDTTPSIVPPAGVPADQATETLPAEQQVAQPTIPAAPPSPVSDQASSAMPIVPPPPGEGLAAPVPVTPAGAPAANATPEAVEQTIPGGSVNPQLSEDDYVREAASLRQTSDEALVKAFSTSGIQDPQQTASDMLRRIDDALLVDTTSYVSRTTDYTKPYHTPEELLALVREDFSLSPEAEKAAADYINTQVNLREQSAYTAALAFAGLTPEELPFTRYKELQQSATKERIKELYTERTKAEGEEEQKRLDEEIAIAIATYFKLGIPYSHYSYSIDSWVKSLDSSVFGTDFVSLQHVPDYGQSDQSSIEADDINKALSSILRERGGLPNGSFAPFTSYNPQQQNEILDEVANHVTDQYKLKLEEGGQNPEVAKNVLRQILAAALAKEQDAAKYPMRNRPPIMLP